MASQEPTDEELMRRFQRIRDENAVNALVDRCYGDAYAVARALLNDAAAAEDAVQDTFVRVIGTADRFDVRRPFRPWLMRILRNVCHDALRRRRRHDRRLADYADLQQAGPANRAVDVGALLARLAPADREFLTLRFVQGHSVRRVGEILGCGEEAAKKRGQRALERLRRLHAAETDPDAVCRNDVRDTLAAPFFSPTPP